MAIFRADCYCLLFVCAFDSRPLKVMARFGEAKYTHLQIPNRAISPSLGQFYIFHRGIIEIDVHLETIEAACRGA
jgi:hypothetical protein